ncbi:S8 family serine peptidase, partial [Rothia nasisuis]
MLHQRPHIGLALFSATLVLVSGVVAQLPAQAVTESPTPSALPSIPTIDTPRGDSIRARQYWLTQYGIIDLWEQSTGKGVTVAVIDTGVDGTHQDLENNVVAGYDASTGTTASKGWE